MSLEPSDRSHYFYVELSVVSSFLFTSVRPESIAKRSPPRCRKSYLAFEFWSEARQGRGQRPLPRTSLESRTGFERFPAQGNNARTATDSDGEGLVPRRWRDPEGASFANCHNKRWREGERERERKNDEEREWRKGRRERERGMGEREKWLPEGLVIFVSPTGPGKFAQFGAVNKALGLPGERQQLGEMRGEGGSSGLYISRRYDEPPSPGPNISYIKR